MEQMAVEKVVSLKWDSQKHVARNWQARDERDILQGLGREVGVREVRGG